MLIVVACVVFRDGYLAPLAQRSRQPYFTAARDNVPRLRADVSIRSYWMEASHSLL